jgi:hypothetical protein
MKQKEWLEKLNKTPRSKEWKENISKSRKGKKHPHRKGCQCFMHRSKRGIIRGPMLEETKAKLRGKRKPLSDELKRRIREGTIKAWSNVELRKRASLSHMGERNHAWKGGKSFEPYTIEWTETLRRSIRERDHYTCQICGLIQGDIAHDIHHIDYDKANSNPKNLITLCHACHTKTNFNRPYWLNYFSTNA